MNWSNTGSPGGERGEAILRQRATGAWGRGRGGRALGGTGRAGDWGTAGGALPPANWRCTSITQRSKCLARHSDFASVLLRQFYYVQVALKID